MPTTSILCREEIINPTATEVALARLLRLLEEVEDTAREIQAAGPRGLRRAYPCGGDSVLYALSIVNATIFNANMARSSLAGEIDQAIVRLED